MKSVFAIRLADALSWHGAPKSIAGIAERAGFRVRARNWQWEVWATDDDFAGLFDQLASEVGK